MRGKQTLKFIHETFQSLIWSYIIFNCAITRIRYRPRRERRGKTSERKRLKLEWNWKPISYHKCEQIERDLIDSTKEKKAEMHDMREYHWRLETCFEKSFNCELPLARSCLLARNLLRHANLYKTINLADEDEFLRDEPYNEDSRKCVLERVQRRRSELKL